MTTQKQLLVAALSFGVSLYSSAQTTFQRTFGGSGDDVGRYVQQTSDEGYVIAGYTSSFGAGGSDVYLIKTTASGDTAWTKTFGREVSAEAGNSVQQTSDGGYVIGATYFIGPGTLDIYMIKTNTTGDTLWTRTFGGRRDDYCSFIQQTTDGGYVIAGSTDSFGAGSIDVYLIKTNADGDTLWTRTYGGIGTDGGYFVQQTSDGGYVIAGRTWSFGAGNGDVYLIKTNAVGDTLWTRVFGGSSYDYGWCVQETNDGGYIIAGWTWSFGAGSYDAYLIKTNAAGSTLWTKTYGGSGSDVAYSVQQTNDGGYVIAGYTTSSGAGFSDVYLIKTNAGGDTLWTKTFGASGYDYGNSVQQTSDGGYVIVGATTSFGAGQGDVYLIKTNGNGVVSVSAEISIPRSFALEQNYPNPFNPSTTIKFALPKASHVTLKVYDLLGKEVATLVNEPLSPATYERTFNGEGLASGVYFYRLQAGSFINTKKMLLMR